MTTQIGDEVMIVSQELHQPVRAGEIRGVSDDPGGVVYVVQWSDTGHESVLRPGPDVVIKHRSGRGSGAVAAGVSPRLFRLRHPLRWRRRRDLERSQQVYDQELAWRVQDIIAGLGLTHTDFSIGGGRIIHIPEVVSVDDGPPVRLDIHILPGQLPDDFSAHAEAIAYDLGMAAVRVVPLGPSLIRLELLPSDLLPGESARESVPSTSRGRDRS